MVNEDADQKQVQQDYLDVKHISDQVERVVSLKKFVSRVNTYK